MNTLNNKKWLTHEEAMLDLGIGRTTLYNWRRNNLIKWAKIGKKIYVLRDSIEQLLNANCSEFR